MTDLELKTPLAKAILDAAREMNESVKDQVENAQPGGVKAYVFGGAAVHIYTKVRGSADIDVEHDAAGMVDFSDVVVTYEDDSGSELLLTIDGTFNSTLGPLHEDYTDRAVELFVESSEPLWVYLVSAVDIAISKLDRFAEVDQNDIIALAKAKRFTKSEFKRLAEEAIDYHVGDSGKVSSQLKQILSKIK